MKKRIVTGLLAFLLVLCLLPIGNIEAYAQGSEGTYISGAVTYGSSSSAVGFQFYPGGGVDYDAYGPLLSAIANKGYFVISIRMPFNMAFFNFAGAGRYLLKYCNIQTWYVGGHSLGGAMVASYAAIADTVPWSRVVGVILLAAYSLSDLDGLKVFSAYGSEDGVLNMDTYVRYRDNLTDSCYEIIIAGGNHSQFGDYGLQDGDGVATISAEEQVRITADAIDDFIRNY